MKQEQFDKIIRHITNCIEDAGYTAEDQILAYVLTGDESYITREGNARDWILKLDRKQIEKYLRLL